MSNKTVTTQSASGLAQGKFDSVSFSVVVEGRGNTGPSAKEETASVVHELEASLAHLKEQGINFKNDEDRATLQLSKEHRYDEESGRNIFSGYLATYSLQVRSTDVDRVSEIQDVLTSVEGAEVGSPTFGQEPETRLELQKLALQNAFEVIKKRLTEECEVLELKTDDFEIDTWNANYGQQGRSYSSSNSVVRARAACFDESMGGGPIEIKSGLAEVSVSLNVGYRRKHQHQ